MLYTSPPEPKPTHSVARPLIGFAISICLAVVLFLTGCISACGPGGGNSSSATLSHVSLALSSVCVFSSVGCFIWFIVVLVINSGRQ